MRRRTFLAASTSSLILPSLLQAEASDKLRVAVVGHTGRGNFGHGLDTVWLDVPATETKLLACWPATKFMPDTKWNDVSSPTSIPSRTMAREALASACRSSAAKASSISTATSSRWLILSKAVACPYLHRGPLVGPRYTLPCRRMG